MQPNLHELGFILDPAAVHGRRSISIKDITLLFQSTTPTLGYEEIRQLVIEDNILAKHTHSARQGILRCLREFYGLNPDLVIYNSLRFFWQYADLDRPLLALLCAAARDPILQRSAKIVLPWPQNTPLPKAALEKYLQGKYPQTYSPNVLARMVRNIMASWKQAGHLSGHRAKIRTQAVSGPASAAYALYLGYLSGLRGNCLFESQWIQFLDVSTAQIHNYAFAAANRGWLNYKNAGGIVEISFPAAFQTKAR